MRLSFTSEESFKGSTELDVGLNLLQGSDANSFIGIGAADCVVKAFLAGFLLSGRVSLDCVHFMKVQNSIIVLYF